MNFNLLNIEIDTNATSWISFFGIGVGWNTRYLFHIEWNYRKEIKYVELFFINIY